MIKYSKLPNYARIFNHKHLGHIPGESEAIYTVAVRATIEHWQPETLDDIQVIYAHRVVQITINPRKINPPVSAGAYPYVGYFLGEFRPFMAVGTLAYPVGYKQVKWFDFTYHRPVETYTESRLSVACIKDDLGNLVPPRDGYYLIDIVEDKGRAMSVAHWSAGDGWLLCDNVEFHPSHKRIIPVRRIDHDQV